MERAVCAASSANVLTPSVCAACCTAWYGAEDTDLSKAAEIGIIRAVVSVRSCSIPDYRAGQRFQAVVRASGPKSGDSDCPVLKTPLTINN